MKILIESFIGHLTNIVLILEIVSFVILVAQTSSEKTKESNICPHVSSEKGVQSPIIVSVSNESLESISNWIKNFSLKDFTEIEMFATSNRTFDDCNVDAGFMCITDYPIEWVEVYTKDIDKLTDIKNDIHKTLWSERVPDNAHYDNQTLGNETSPLDGKRTTYFAFLRVLYTESLCVAANYSCRMVGDPCVQTNVVAVVDQEAISYQLSNKTIDMDSHSENCEAIISVSINSDGEPGWKCTSTKTNQSLLHAGHRVCDSAMHCNSFFRHQRKQNCVKKLPADYPCDDCMDMRYGVHPGFIWCENSIGEVLTAVQFFFSIPQFNSSLPELCKFDLDWTEADPQKMLYLESIQEEEIYVGQNVTFFCSISRYYFAFGHRFAFQFDNKSIHYDEINEGEKETLYNVNRMNVTLGLTHDLQMVYCFAPIWNSTEWVNKSLIINAKNDSSPPSLELIFDNGETSFEREKEVQLILHERNKTITCKGTGKPTPEVKWIPVANHEEMFGVGLVNESKGTQKLFFRYITHSSEGRWKCVGSNFLTSQTLIVDIKVKDEIAVFVRITSAFVTVLVVLFGITLFIFRKKIKRKPKPLPPALTDEEIRVFREGNLETVQNSAFLDSDELLQALQYNYKFEIPRKKLFVDTSAPLGSGHFGQVYKGFILGTRKNRKVLEVAVKTVQPNCDIKYFKSVLSEAKIMSYIGEHANVVSLVRACTENIRNKKVYIAVEYCPEGSLDQFLKKSRISFVNLIRNDTIYINTSAHSGDDPHKHEDMDSEKVSDKCDISATSISTKNLLKWSREIANGMGFLSSKKIIHGDLATRNVLLTKTLVAKIGDFGLSRLLQDYSSYVRSTGDDCELPWKWMALEVLREGKFSSKADVWSYGVTLWEIFSLGQHPYPRITWNRDFIDRLEDGLRLHKPAYATSHLYNLMLDCWASEPTDRPRFTELKDVFEGLLLYSCSSDYFRTDTVIRKDSKHYVNTSGSISVNNPTYSVIRNKNSDLQKEQKVSSMLENGKERVKFKNNRCGRNSCEVLEEDVHGYLKPLMMTTFEDENENV